MLPPDIERMLRILGPGDPRVQRLLRAAQRDPGMMGDVRAILRRRCLALGFDPDDPSPFLPPRAHTVPADGIPIGTVPPLTGPPQPVGLPARFLTEHIGIFGSTGQGKTFLAISLAARAIEKGCTAWILDPENEWTRLVPILPTGAPVALALRPGHLRLNLFEPPGPWIAPENWWMDMILVFRGTFYLREVCTNRLLAALRQIVNRKRRAGDDGWPSVTELLECFSGMPIGPKSRTAAAVESLIDRLETLAADFPATANVTQSDMLRALASQRVVFRVSPLSGIPLQFLTSYLLRWLVRYREGAPAASPHLVVIEEPHLLASDPARQDIGEHVLCRTFRTARKRGTALVLSDQAPSLLPAPVLANLGTRIIMRLVHPKCIWSVQTSMGMTREQGAMIPELESRQAVFHSPEMAWPTLIQVPHVDLPPAPPDDALDAAAEQFLARTTWRETAPPAAQDIRPATPASPNEISGDALLVMIRILEHPAESIEDRCAALTAMDRQREFRARAFLETRGLIAKASQGVGKYVFYQPTRKGLAWASERNLPVTRHPAGLQHEWILIQVEKAIGQLPGGWRTQRNSDICRDQGLRPDLVVLAPDGTTTIVEVICNNIAFDVENLLAEAAGPNVDGLVALAPDQRTAQAVDRELLKQQTQAPLFRRGPIRVFFAAQCFADDFDWPALLTAP